ncbi:MAG: tetratricopeptide repeat protein [Verrucomicrobiota bacterium]
MTQDRHINAALGYIKLGLFEDALQELEGVDPEQRSHPEVLSVWVEAYASAQKWQEMQRIALHLTTVQPENAQWWIHLAFATRRAESLSAARNILMQAEKLHPNEPTIQFNLGCYACQLGELNTAREHVHRAIERMRTFLPLALKDTDLEPLWNDLKQSSSIVIKD